MINKGQIVYYARILPTVDIFEILELKIRTVEEFYFVGTDNNTQQAFLFSNKAINKTVFFERKDALIEEKNKKNIEKSLKNAQI